MKTFEVTICERGNGFPDDGDYVPGDDGELYKIVKCGNNIFTGNRPGASNYIYATVTLADWDDCSEEDIHSCISFINN